MNIRALPPSPARRDERSFVLQRAQPAMTGLIDGSLSTLAPIFAVGVRQRRARSSQLSAAGARC
jgi:erythrin-vacuolar iron transport family protein